MTDVAATFRRLLDDRDYKHYHRGSEGQWVYRCEGLDCIGLPVLVLALIIIFGLATVTTVTCLAVSTIRRRRAFKLGVVPASMVLSGHARYSKTAGGETTDKYVMKLKKIPAHDQDEENAGTVVREDSCPVCLKAAVDLKILIELGCKHQLCEECFDKIVRKDRLHARCPLCRVYMMDEKEGAENCCRGPTPGEADAQPQVLAQRSQHMMVV